MARHGKPFRPLLIILLIAACVVFVWSGYKFISREKEYADARADYDALRDTFNQSAASGDESESAASNIDFDGLRAVNPEVVGWVDIPGTSISYPIAQTSDNDKYLKVSFDGQSSSSGAIFADKDCQSDLMGSHTIIYGHHMRDGSMFAELVNFKDADFFDSHSEIILTTPERQMHLTVIAAYAVNADEPLRRFTFNADEFQAFLSECVAKSELKREGVDLSQVDRLYTFVTCSYEADDMRTVVHAVELG